PRQPQSRPGGIRVKFPGVWFFCTRRSGRSSPKIRRWGWIRWTRLGPREPLEAQGGKKMLSACNRHRISGGFGGASRLLPRAGLSFAACFSVDQAAAQSAVCPGVTVSIHSFPGGPVVATACGANTGAFSADNSSSNIQDSIEELRKKKQKL